MRDIGPWIIHPESDFCPRMRQYSLKRGPFQRYKACLLNHCCRLESWFHVMTLLYAPPRKICNAVQPAEPTGVQVPDPHTFFFHWFNLKPHTLPLLIPWTHSFLLQCKKTASTVERHPYLPWWMVKNLCAHDRLTWTDRTETAFTDLKGSLQTAPTFGLPKTDVPFPQFGGQKDHTLRSLPDYFVSQMWYTASSFMLSSVKLASCAAVCYPVNFVTPQSGQCTQLGILCVITSWASTSTTNTPLWVSTT